MIDYKKLKVDQLKKEWLQRDIVCKQTKEVMSNSLMIKESGYIIPHN